jgi:hypothetical protein
VLRPWGGGSGSIRLVTLAAVVTFNGLALPCAREVNAGEPTPFIGLYERIAFGAYYLWLSALAVALWRRRPSRGWMRRSKPTGSS